MSALVLSRWCSGAIDAPDAHNWCANRSYDETHCECWCHLKRAIETPEAILRGQLWDAHQKLAAVWALRDYLATRALQLRNKSRSENSINWLGASIYEEVVEKFDDFVGGLR